MELSSFKFIQSVTPIACTSAIQRGFDLKRLAQHQISSGSSALILTPLKQQRVPLFAKFPECSSTYVAGNVVRSKGLGNNDQKNSPILSQPRLARSRLI